MTLSAHEISLLSQTLDLDPTQSPNLLNNVLTIPAHTAPGLAEFDDFGACDVLHGFPLGRSAT